MAKTVATQIIVLDKLERWENGHDLSWKKQLALESQLNNTEQHHSQRISELCRNIERSCWFIWRLQREMQGMNFTGMTRGWQALRLFRLLFYHKMLLGILKTSDVEIKDLSSFSWEIILTTLLYLSQDLLQFYLLVFHGLGCAIYSSKGGCTKQFQKLST